MAENFDDEDDDYKNEFDGDDFDDSEEYKKIPIDEYEDLIFENEELREENYGLLRQEINEKLISDSIEICSNTWFWSWKNIDYKIGKIKEVYLHLRDLIEDGDDIEIEF